MRRSDFYYELPQELIAQQPLLQRSASRLLILDGASGRIQDGMFGDLVGLLNPADLLVLNDTRVIPARLFGYKASGGKVGLLVERILDEYRALAHVRASKAPKPGAVLHIEGGLELVVEGRQEDLFQLRFPQQWPVFDGLQRFGHVPLPPYIQRAEERSDLERYQTVFAERPGAIAAPTAGLHFDEELIACLTRRGVVLSRITLHVGAGTFQPVRSEEINNHRMHKEQLEVSPEVCAQIEAVRARGGRIVAVGTTVVRALESAARQGSLKPMRGETDLFIRPGYSFRVVDALITNFHLPESSLLMLVCAFAGYEQVMNAYRHAIAHRYRFFSYGDAMFVARTA